MISPQHLHLYLRIFMASTFTLRFLQKKKSYIKIQKILNLIICTVYLPFLMACDNPAILQKTPACHPPNLDNS